MVKNVKKAGKNCSKHAKEVKHNGSLLTTANKDYHGIYFTWEECLESFFMTAIVYYVSHRLTGRINWQATANIYQHFTHDWC